MKATGGTKAVGRGLPEGWVQAAVGDAARYINGLAFRPVDWGTRGRPIIRIQNLTDPSKPFNYTEREVAPDFVVRPGSILVSWSATLDAFVWPGPEAVLNQHIFRVEPNPRLVLGAFLFWQLKQVIREMSEGEHLHGSTMRHINRKPFLAHPLRVAPLKEQARIVAAIETQFTRLDEAVATLKAVQAKLKRARASILKAAVEGRLVPTEAELARAEDRSYEPAPALLERILAERRARWPTGKKYQPPAEQNTNDLATLPEGWAWTTLEAAAEVVGGVTKNKRTERGREVPYLRVANVQRGRLDLSHVKNIVATEAVIAELRLAPGDILLNEGGDRDKLGRGWVWEGQLPECIHQNHVFRARVWLPALHPKYLSHYANSLGQTYFLGEGKQTTNLASISLSKIKLLPVAVPPAAEQVRMVAEAERRLSVIDNLDHTVGQSIARCDRLRQSILKQAFEGRLVPQDPADEPARELLARIRRQRDNQADGVAPTRRRAVSKAPVGGKRKSLIEVLELAAGPLSPEELLTRSGHSSQTVDEFYDELRLAVDAGTVRERRLGNDAVVLELVRR